MSTISPADHEDMELGAAWRRATDALPEGWRLWGLCLSGDVDDLAWDALAVTPDEEEWAGHGATPTAALDALTAALRERSA